MPELPEVEGLALDLRGRLDGRAIARVDIAAFSALKTFDPPLTALNGSFVDDVTRAIARPSSRPRRSSARPSTSGSSGTGQSLGGVETRVVCCVTLVTCTR